MYLSFLFLFHILAMIKYPDRKQLREHFQITTHHSSEVTVAGESWPHHIHRKEQREMNAFMLTCLLACAKIDFSNLTLLRIYA